MAYEDVIAPYITAMVQELPSTALQLEIAEAIAWGFEWETWRTMQSPPPADTQANRIAFAKAMWAKKIKMDVIRWLSEYRHRGDNEAAEVDA